MIVARTIIIGALTVVMAGVLIPLIILSAAFYRLPSERRKNDDYRGRLQ